MRLLCHVVDKIKYWLVKNIKENFTVFVSLACVNVPMNTVLLVKM